MALPTTLKRRVIRNSYLVTDKAAATLPITTTDDLFTVSGGRVEILQILGEVTDTIQDQQCYISLKMNPTVGSTVTFAFLTECRASEIGSLISTTTEIFNAGTQFRQMFIVSSGIITASVSRGFIASPGVIQLATSATNTGSIKWSCLWREFDEGASVAAA